MTFVSGLLVACAFLAVLAVPASTSARPPITDRWLALSTRGAPRLGSTNVVSWTGTEMIVWGRSASDATVVDGGRYDPRTDAWTMISQEGALGPRVSPVSVWTGTELLIWGGHRGDRSPIGTTLDDGARYNPGTDTWRPMAGQGAPSSRTGASAVWTGTELLVFGGLAGGTAPLGIPLQDGARYDPVSDTWTPMSPAVGIPWITPNPAIWTGEEMIVRRARYNPGLDTWTELVGTPGIGFPPVRLWTGREVIEWGGHTGALRESTSCSGVGARLDPNSGGWTPLAAAPLTGRSFPYAVWLGTELWIWGGACGISFFRDGARYNPETNAWRGLPDGVLGPWAGSPNSLRPRGGSLIWTGQELIWWNSSNQATRYAPSDLPPPRSP